MIMKVRIYFFVLTLFWASIQIGVGQDQTDSKLVDEFGKMPSHQLHHRVDDLMNLLVNNNSRGLVILNAPKGLSIGRYLNERRIEGCLLNMKYDSSLVSYVFAERSSDMLVQLWEVPPNASNPQFSPVPHDYKLADLSKPYMIQTLNVEESFCPVRFDLEFYSRFLKANPTLTGKIVIYEKTSEKFYREKLKYFRNLSQGQKVSSRQIKFARGKYYGTPDAEFWLIPQKK